MSNDIHKADQIAFHFYTKLFYAVNDARATEGHKVPFKVDKWFNLETPDSDLFTKEAREPYRNISQAPSSGPVPFEIQVVLSVPELANNQVLVYMSPDSFRVRIEPTPKFIVLETWTLECAPHLAGYNEQFNNNADIALPIIYKHGIVLFRSVFSMLRILPAWKFYKRLRRKTSGMNRNGNFGIQLRTRPLSVDGAQSQILEFNHSPSPIHRQPFPTSTHTFPPIPHILGIFTLSTSYLDNPNFQLDELESLLSSRFISLDREEFLPTLEKNRQRDSISGSSLPSSSGIKSITSRSPPMQIARATSAGGGVLPGMDSISVAERFILPSSIGTTASTGSSALIPPPRPFPSMNTGTANIGVNTSSPSGLALNRLRKESMNSSSSSLVSMRDNVAGTSSPLSSSPSSGPVPIRKPNIFKTNTVSSASGSSPSLSIRQGGSSSLTRDNVGPAAVPSAGGGTHSRQPSYHSPVPNVTRLPPSPIGATAHNFGSPSSSSDRRPGTSGSGASSDRDRRTSMNSIGFGTTAVEEGTQDVGPTMPTRKRYSSSFGHRYTGSGASSLTGTSAAIAGSTTNGGVVSLTPSAVGVPQSQGGGSSSTPGSPVRGNTPAGSGTEGLTSYLSTATDDDDISVFVQDIDSRKPLSGRMKQLVKGDEVQDPVGTGLQELRHDRETTDITLKSKQKDSTSDEIYRSRFTDVPVTTSPLQRSLSVPNETEREAVEDSSTSPPRGLMLTSQGEVDERLSKMKEVFLRSIEGLGSGNGSRRKEKDKDLPNSAASKTSESSSSGDPLASRGMNIGIGFPSQGSDTPSRGPYAYNNNTSLGMPSRPRHASTSSSTLGNSQVGASQGSEEVIGRMDLYEERRRGSYRG